MSDWVDRQRAEPPKNARVIVWGEEDWPQGAIAVEFNYGEWCDVVDKVSVVFRFWQLAPETPYAEQR